MHSPDESAPASPTVEPVHGPIDRSAPTGGQTRGHGLAREGLAHEGLAFVLIGGGAALGFIVLSNVLLRLDLGVPFWLVSALCYGAFVLPTYLAQHRLTFRSSRRHRDALPKYLTTQAVAMVASAAIAWPVYHGFALDPLPGSIIITGLTSVGNFILLKLWTFADPAVPARAASHQQPV